MSRRETAEHLAQIRESEGDTVRATAERITDQTVDAIEAFPRFEDLRQEARAIKANAIENLPELIERLTEAVEENGGSVYVADDAEDANDYIVNVATEIGAETAVKSKSMTTEEIELNDALIEAGVEPFETDLGELVIQVADESPSHLIGPAFHRTPEEIADLFNERLDVEEPLSADPAELTEFARDFVGERIREADLGITGANFVTADSGTIAIVTNEGNARKSALVPNTHVAVTGIEKIIPSLEELAPFVELIARSGTGQDISSYVSLMTPPTESPTFDFDRPDEPLDPDGEREFHLVLIDNGRSEMREDEQLRETLYCIRCGACANTCANFQSLGGHAFGGETYTGGIGTGWEYGVHGDEGAKQMNDLCTGCGRCTTKCPVDIDIPWINTVVRDRLNRGADPGTFDSLVDGLTPDEESAGIDIQKRIFGNIETLAGLASKTPRLANAAAGSGIGRRVMERTVGIDRRRELPQFARTTLREWAADRDTVDGDREVVLYPDLYTNYFMPDRGKAAVRTLEALGVSVHVPAVPESGRAPLSQGMIRTATRQAEAVADALQPHLEAGRDVVVVEPSDLSMFRDDYERFLEDERFRELSAASYEIMEYIDALLPHVDTDGLGPLPEKLQYHGHCQARSLGFSERTVSVLESLGCEVSTSTVECCGMAGSFGYKTEYYETSMDVGDQLAEELTDLPIVASGASCSEQIGAYDRDAPHPIELLDPGA